MPTMARLRPLESIPCFADLSPEVMEELGSLAREVSFAKGEVIILEGEPCPGLFVVKSGSVKLYRSSPEGGEQIVRIVRRGGCFECAALFDQGSNPVSAQALEATSLYLIPASAFHSFVRAHPEVVLAIVPILARRLRSLLGLVEDFSFRRVSSRLAKLLLSLSEERGERLVVSPSQPLDQQHLACMLGCSRQVVNRSLRKLVREGIVGMEGRRIVVLKPGALRERTL